MANQEELIGQRVGKFRVIRLIALRGLSKVYLTQDESLERQVALKILPRAFASVSDYFVDQCWQKNPKIAFRRQRNWWQRLKKS